jgi:drug/metabolite transporter (DMT)-like permease
MKMLVMYSSCFFLTLFTLIGDIFLKQATLENGLTTKARWLIISTMLVWGMVPYGWYIFLKHYTMFEAGVLFTSIALIGGSMIAVLWYEEPVAPREWVGLALALASIICMGKGE